MCGSARRASVEVGAGVSWRERAACKGMDPDLFHPERGATVAVQKAKRVCAGCPVRSECLDEALENGEVLGVLGGLSERQRRWLRSPTRHGVRADCVGCGNGFVTAEGRVCGDCKKRGVQEPPPRRFFDPEDRDCVDCGESYVARAPNAKRCERCRGLIALERTRQWKREQRRERAS